MFTEGLEYGGTQSIDLGPRETGVESSLCPLQAVPVAGGNALITYTPTVYLRVGILMSTSQVGTQRLRRYVTLGKLFKLSAPQFLTLI